MTENLDGYFSRFVIKILSFVELNECASNPCKHNSTCLDLVAAFECTCIDGYTGLTCSTGQYI